MGRSFLSLVSGIGSVPEWSFVGKQETIVETYVCRALYGYAFLLMGKKGMCPPSNPDLLLIGQRVTEKNTWKTHQSAFEKIVESICGGEGWVTHFFSWGKSFFYSYFFSFFFFWRMGGCVMILFFFFSFFDVCSLTPRLCVLHNDSFPTVWKQSSLWKCQKIVSSVIVLCAEETMNIPRLYKFRIHCYPKDGFGFLKVLLHLFMW